MRAFLRSTILRLPNYIGTTFTSRYFGTMQSTNRLQRSLQTGLSFGHWQQYAGANISRTLAQSGVDWVCIDCEHGEIGDAAMHDSVPAVAACGVSPVVRVPANEAWMVKRALDAGAHGIIVPLLYSADDARRVVSHAKFPPMGARGYGSAFPQQCFPGVGPTQYLKEANDAIVTIVQIETREALEAVDEIAKVPGVDVLLVGPNDLGINIGHPITNGVMAAELNAAIDRVHEVAVANGKRTGIFCASGEQANAYVRKGFHMVTVTADSMILPPVLARQLKAARG